MSYWQRRTKAELVAEVERLEAVVRDVRRGESAIREDERKRCGEKAEKAHRDALVQATAFNKARAAARKAAHPLERIAVRLQLQGAFDSRERAESWRMVSIDGHCLTAADVARITYALGLMHLPPVWLRDDDEEEAA